MKTKGFVIGAVVVLAIAIIGGVILLQNQSDNTPSVNESFTDNTNNASKQKLIGNELVQSILNKVKSEVPTVEKTRIYNEDTDSNNMLGKSGQYQYAGAFYDTRTNQDGMDYSTSNDYGTDAGGVIEIFATVEDAQSRGTYLAAFQKNSGFLNPGEHRVIENIVLRVSPKYKSSEQKEMLDLMSSTIN